MKNLLRLVAWVASAAFFIASPALAQNPGPVINHAFAIGKGAGTSFTSLLCATTQLPIGQTSADPICRTVTGDVTINAAGVTAIGATKVTSAMLNSDVFSTAHSWPGQQTFVAPILGTPASGTATNLTGLPISTGVSGLGTGVSTALGVNVGSAGAFVTFNGALGTPSSATLTSATGLPISTGVSGLGTGVATFLATPSSANLRAALTDEVGTGAAYFVGGALGTPASGTLTNATGLPLSGLNTQAAYTIVANNSGSTAVPTAVDIAAITTKASPAAGDYILLSDQAASGAFKKATVASVASAGSVASLNTLTGALTLLTPPQGRLTLTSNTPVMATSATAQTTLYYDCYGGNQVPYYTGSADALGTISSCQVSTAMVSAASAGQVVSGNVYDVWWSNGGANKICIAMSASGGGGGGWSSDTGGSNTARGTGYTQLDRTTRPYATNANSITNCFNGSTNYGPISANQGTYLGTVYASGNGQISYTFGSSAAGGGAALFGVWNMYNRVNVTTTVTDSTASWATTTSATAANMDASTANRLTAVFGLAQEGSHLSLNAEVIVTTGFGKVGFGLDATAFDKYAIVAGAGANISTGIQYAYAPQVGLHYWQATQAGDGTNAVTVGGGGVYSFSADLAL